MYSFYSCFTSALDGDEWLCGNLKKRDHMEDKDVHGRIILKWIENKHGDM
jgi:hypothetical protein